jgi:hypothetical protein
VLVVGFVALAVLASGCTSASSGMRPDATTMLTQDRHREPLPVSWAQAVTLAHQMLSRLVLPPGARPCPTSALPTPLRGPASLLTAFRPPTPEAQRAYRLPQSMRQAFQYVLSHPPSGTLPGEVSNVGLSGLTDRAVTYLLRTEPSGVWVTQLAVIVAPRPGGGSFLTADAHVTVFLLSSARLDPAALHVVTVSVTAFNSKPHRATRIIRSATVVARLANLVNQMPPVTADISRPVTCPPTSVFYLLDFAASASGPTTASVAVDMCGIANVSVHGTPGGPRLDKDEKLFQAASQLLPT